MPKLLSVTGMMVLGALASACGSTDNGGAGQAPGCTPGVAYDCTCTDGTHGQQVCDESGTSLGICTMCGNVTPIAPDLPTNSGGMDAGVDPDPINPGGYPSCGTNPDTQPSPCMDASGALLCKVDTGYPGDHLALCPLDPEDGMMIHFGPQDYDDPNQVAPFLLAPGGEEEFCMHLNTPNQTDRFVASYHGRMRPNSHHLIVTMPTQHSAQDTVPYQCSSQVLDRWLFGAQDPTIDVVNGFGSVNAPAQPGDPDYGLAQVVPANQTLLFDFHNVNTTGDVSLREAWASFKYVDPSEVVNTVDMIAFYQLDISIPPLASATTQRKTCSAGNQQPIYVGLLTGHAHERLTRFSVYHNKNDGTQPLVYETTDWAEPGNAVYRDASQNPSLPLTNDAVWGATSGFLRIEPGESLSFECQFQNNLNTTVQFGDTTSDEMCNVFGMYYPSLGGMWNCLF